MMTLRQWAATSGGRSSSSGRESSSTCAVGCLEPGRVLPAIWPAGAPPPSICNNVWHQDEHMQAGQGLSVCAGIVHVSSCSE